MSILDRWACFIRVSVNSIGQEFKFTNIVTSQLRGDLTLAYKNMTPKSSQWKLRFNRNTCKYINIINSSFDFEQGIIPDSLKIAKVVPIHKVVKLKFQITVVRPICLLDSFSKIYEKLIHNRIIEFLDHSNTLLTIIGCLLESSYWADEHDAWDSF